MHPPPPGPRRCGGRCTGRAGRQWRNGAAGGVFKCDGFFHLIVREVVTMESHDFAHFVVCICT